MNNTDEYVEEINSFEEYILFIKNYFNDRQEELWYRGQRSNHWGLKPNLFRDAIMDLDSEYGVASLSYKFVDFKEELLSLKKEMMNKEIYGMSNLNNFQIMFIAQHYGLLTPILDWTTDPLVALFFALDGYKPNNEHYPVIHILEPGTCNSNTNYTQGDNDITEPLNIDDMDDLFMNWIDDLNKGEQLPLAIFSEVDFSHRISRQSGKFTIHKAVGPINYSWNDIALKDKRMVDKIKINPEAVEGLREFLSVLNINKQTIYRNTSTEMDKVCEQIKDQGIKSFKQSINKINSSVLKS